MQCWSQEETCVAETISRDVEQRRGAEDFGDVEQKISESGAEDFGDVEQRISETWSRGFRRRGAEDFGNRLLWSRHGWRREEDIEAHGTDLETFEKQRW